MAEWGRQRGSGAAAASSAEEASAARGRHWQYSRGGDGGGGGGSLAAVSSGEAGLQGSSDGGGRVMAFICTSFAVYEFIFLSMFQ